MARCTAPVKGHHSTAAAANCPACRGRYGGYSRSYSTPSYSNSGYGNGSRSQRASTSYNSGSRKPSWSPSGSSVNYTIQEVRALTPIRHSIETRSHLLDPRDVFLCHAWDDRTDSAKKLHDLLESQGVTVWFSEKDVLLGSTLLREIDKGLARSRVGVVLVTPALLNRLKGEGIADKELATLLATELLVPVVHNTTYEALLEVSPMLASRSGMSTAEGSMENIAIKLAELITL